MRTSFAPQTPRSIPSATSTRPKSTEAPPEGCAYERRHRQCHGPALRGDARARVCDAAAFLGPTSPIRLAEIPEPKLPGPEWVKVRVDAAGICGSDLHLVRLETSPSASVYASMPFTIGHENVGTVIEAGPASQVPVGHARRRRALLPCVTRGFSDLCAACARGDYNLCSRFAEGALAAGIGHGACRDTGGAWGQVLVAHRSRLVVVPSNLTDEHAVLVEPLAVAVHAVLRFVPRDARTVLVIGAGTIGLAGIAALADPAS